MALRNKPLTDQEKADMYEKMRRVFMTHRGGVFPGQILCVWAPDRRDHLRPTAMIRSWREVEEYWEALEEGVYVLKLNQPGTEGGLLELARLLWNDPDLYAYPSAAIAAYVCHSRALDESVESYVSLVDVLLETILQAPVPDRATFDRQLMRYYGHSPGGSNGAD